MTLEPRHKIKNRNMQDFLNAWDYLFGISYALQAAINEYS